jgi:hypothetical protein
MIMFSKLLILLSVTQAIFAQDDTNNPCKSYGVDYLDGGVYYQNINSSEPFSFVSYYEGCQQDNAQNILVDPSGLQYLCTDTPLTPADTPEISIW